MMGRWLAFSCCILLAACASAGALPAGGGSPASAEPSPLAPPEPDRSCEVDADCAVKNVGNCCGYFPACVNARSETFPDQVRQACEREGRSSICGFPDIQGCRCVNRRCEASSAGSTEVM